MVFQPKIIQNLASQFHGIKVVLVRHKIKPKSAFKMAYNTFIKPLQNFKTIVSYISGRSKNFLRGFQVYVTKMDVTY